MASRTDRNGTTRAFTYDDLGRQVADRVTALGHGVDGSVLRIETAYDDAGRPYLFTSYDAADGGAVVNQVRRSYDGLGRLVSEWQEHDGPVTPATPSVGYAYDAMPGGDHSRRTATTYPSGWVLGYDYGGGTDGVDGRVSRLSGVTEAGTGSLEALDYLGLNTLVGRRYAEPGLGLTYFSDGAGVGGVGGDPYAGLDRFGRVVDHRWADASGAGGGDVDRFTYGYDRDGNRLYRENALSPAHSELYHPGSGYDGLGRMTAFSRGTLNPAKEGLAGTASRSQGWSLDPLGNWDASSTDGVTETRLHDRENRIQTANGTEPWNGERFTHTPNGETVQMYGPSGDSRDVFTYDAWGRLAVSASDVVTTGGDGRTWEARGGETRFGYDALGRRIVADGRVHVYSKDWQVLEERDAATGTADTRNVWSPAYVDAMVLRDRDTDGDGTLEERLYVLQDANYNVTAVVGEASAAGVGGGGGWAVAERYLFDPYGGNRVVLDGDWQETNGGGGGYAFAHGHQGGRHWQHTSNPADTLVHFRHRDLATRTGRWMRQDPAGYVDGGSFYQGYRSAPARFVDPMGLAAQESQVDPAEAIAEEVGTQVIGTQTSYLNDALKKSAKAGDKTAKLLLAPVKWGGRGIRWLFIAKDTGQIVRGSASILSAAQENNILSDTNSSEVLKRAARKQREGGDLTPLRTASPERVQEQDKRWSLKSVESRSTQDKESG